MWILLLHLSHIHIENTLSYKNPRGNEKLGKLDDASKPNDISIICPCLCCQKTNGGLATCTSSSRCRWRSKKDISRVISYTVAGPCQHMSCLDQHLGSAWHGRRSRRRSGTSTTMMAESTRLTNNIRINTARPERQHMPCRGWHLTLRTDTA